MRKPHAKSVLKNLPFDRQKEIYDRLKAGMTYEACETWLLTQEIETNRDSIGNFYHWFPLHAQLHAANSMGESVTEILRELPLDLDEQRLSKAGQAIFEAAALQNQDSKLFVALRELRQFDKKLELEQASATTKAAHKERSLAQKDRDFALAREKFIAQSCEKIMQAAKDPKMREIVESSKLTGAEKIALIRQAYFADIDSLEVELPA